MCHICVRACVDYYKTLCAATLSITWAMYQPVYYYYHYCCYNNMLINAPITYMYRYCDSLPVRDQPSVHKWEISSHASRITTARLTITFGSLSFRKTRPFVKPSPFTLRRGRGRARPELVVTVIAYNTHSLVLVAIVWLFGVWDWAPVLILIWPVFGFFVGRCMSSFVCVPFVL